MQIILYLIIISLVVAGGFLVAFFWAIKDGQYDDDYTPSLRILVEDDMLPTDGNPCKETTILIQNKNNQHV